MLVHRTLEVPTWGDASTTRRLRPAPSFELTDMTGGNSVARQRALTSDSLNDEQRSDDLFNPSSH